jgi:hypothetical protein
VLGGRQQHHSLAEQGGRLLVVPKYCIHKRRSAISVPDIGFRAVIEQGGSHSFASGGILVVHHVEEGSSDFTSQIGISARGQQDINKVRQDFGGGDKQGRVAFSAFAKSGLDLLVRIGMVGQESFDRRIVVAVNSRRKWRVAVLRKNIRIGAIVQERFESVQIAAAQGVEDDRISLAVQDIWIGLETDKGFDCFGMVVLDRQGERGPARHGLPSFVATGGALSGFHGGETASGILSFYLSSHCG